MKRELKAKYYARYVDDFVMLHSNQEVLARYKNQIASFLHECLALTLHPTKSRIIPLNQGVDFLGFRAFYYHKLVRKANLRKMQRRLE